MRLKILLVLFLGLLACQSIEQREKAPTSIRPILAVKILPLDDVDVATLQYLKVAIADTFKVEVEILPSTNIPANAWYAARKRYWADSILHWMKRKTGHPTEKWLAVTGKDIAATTIRQYNWGVMGLAHQPGNVCVVSDYRLHGGSTTEEQRRQKLLKIALHELAHTTGLPHCREAYCLLADAEGKDKTEQLTGFCNHCRKHLFGE